MSASQLLRRGGGGEGGGGYHAILSLIHNYVFTVKGSINIVTI